MAVRADVNRDCIVVKFGAFTFIFSRKEALRLTEQIIAAFDELMQRKHGIDMKAQVAQ